MRSYFPSSNAIHLWDYFQVSEGGIVSCLIPEWDLSSSPLQSGFNWHHVPSLKKNCKTWECRPKASMWRMLPVSIVGALANLHPHAALNQCCQCRAVQNNGDSFFLSGLLSLRLLIILQCVISFQILVYYLHKDTMFADSLTGTSSGRALSSLLRAGFYWFFPSRTVEAVEVQERCQFRIPFENYFNTIKFICSHILYKRWVVFS